MKSSVPITVIMLLKLYLGRRRDLSSLTFYTVIYLALSFSAELHPVCEYCEGSRHQDPRDHAGRYDTRKQYRFVRPLPVSLFLCIQVP